MICLLLCSVSFNITYPVTFVLLLLANYLTFLLEYRLMSFLTLFKYCFDVPAFCAWWWHVLPNLFIVFKPYLYHTNSLPPSLVCITVYLIDNFCVLVLCFTIVIKNTINVVRFYVDTFLKLKKCSFWDLRIL